jgi:phosphopantothenate synthetase
MSSSFAKIVEQVKALSPQEKQDLQRLIEKYLIEERREEILESYVRSLTELNEGQLEFSNDAATLNEMLLHDRDLT